MVTDYDCWHPDHESVSVKQIIKTLKENSEKAERLIIALSEVDKVDKNEKIKNLSKNSIITDISKVKPSTRKKLKNILDF